MEIMQLEQVQHKKTGTSKKSNMKKAQREKSAT